MWGPDARDMPGYRDTLIDIAVCVNAAHSAFDLRQEVERTAKWEIEVLYGVFSLHNHQVSMPVNPLSPVAPKTSTLPTRPTNPREFTMMAQQMAELLKPGATTPSPARSPSADPAASASRASDGLILRGDDQV